MGAVKNLVGGGKGGIGSVLGGIAGFAIGGPMGGMMGASLGGSLGGGMDQADAAEQGAKAMQAASASAIAEQKAARLQADRNLSPYRVKGNLALNKLLGFNGNSLAGQSIDMTGLPSILPSDIGSDSLFQSLKREAISGIESSAAARGKLFSGTTPQLIAGRVQDLAMGRAGEIQGMNIAARQGLLGERIAENERKYQQLYNLAGLGQASAAQQAANTMSTASNIGSLMTQSANAAAAGRIGAANAQSAMFQNLLGTGATLYGINKMFP